MGNILDRDFYEQDTRVVAKNLLGKLLVRKVGKKRLSGIIVETEAYRGFDDTASHAHNGPTKRCKVMYEDPGFAYVYLTYGIHCMLNFVTEKKWFPAAVLIRAIEPLEGTEEMLKQRATQEILKLSSGPGKLTKALNIDRTLNGVDLTSGSEIWVEEVDGHMVSWLDGRSFKIGKSARIGIEYADEVSRDAKWRYFIRGNKFVSRK